MKAIVFADANKVYPDLSKFLHRAAAQIDLIIQDQANEDNSTKFDEN